MNLVSEEVVISRADGSFEILVKPEELLIFSAVNFEYKRKLIEAEDIEKGKIQIVLIPKVEKLEEVVVYQNITPEQLGIPAGKKKYTPAERRYRAGAKIEPTIFLIPVPVVVVPMDQVINHITGRAAMLKKELEVEKKEIAIKKMRDEFPVLYLQKRFKIDPENAEGFYYYLVEIPEFLIQQKAKNRLKMELIMSEHLSKFLELQSQE